MSQEIATETAEVTTTGGEATAVGTTETLLTGGNEAGGDGGQGATNQESVDQGQADTGEGGAGKEESPKDPALAIPETPEGYELSFDDGVQVDKALLGTFQEVAHKMGLNAGQAQEVASVYAAHVAEQEKAQQQALAEVQRGWEDEIKESPTFKTDVVNARKTLVQFGSFGTVDGKGNPIIDPELAEVFNETMIGSHPKVFKMFVDIGKALAEPKIMGNGTGSNGGLNFYSTMERD